MTDPEATDPPGGTRRQVRPGEPPTVVFCNGLGMPRELWQPVVDLLPADRAVVTFDRPADTPHAADDLDAQLVEIDEVVADVAGPLLLVGHSYGGVLAEAYARHRPHRVCALVLVDPALPADYAAAPRSVDGATDHTTGGAGSELPWWRNAAIRLSDVEGLRPLLSWVMSAGMVATATRQGEFTATIEGLPEGAIEQIVSVANVTRAMRDDHHLGAICRAVLEDRAAGPLSGIPVRVLVGATGPRAWPADQPGWATKQRGQLADLADDAELRELPGAHLLMLDCPAEIATVITDVAAPG